MSLPRVYMHALRLARAFGSWDKYADRFTASQAAYWWLAHNHDGQWSPEYAELCWLSKYYKPGPHESGPCTDDETILIYEELSTCKQS